MREKAFENQIKKFLKDHGAWFLKTWSNGVQRAGVPDLLACYRGKFIAIEVKAENGRASELQRYEVEQIRKAGGIAMILKPSEFDLFKKFFESL